MARRKALSNIFYVYVWLDPRKPGIYKYGKDISFEFDYEPYYAGKGYGNQYFFHFYGARTNFTTDNQHKFNKIRKILREGFTEEDLKKNYIIKYKTDLSELEAWDFEKLMIATIGRTDLGLGPLTNWSNGGEGPTGRVQSKEQSKNQSERMMGEKNWSFGRTGELSPTFGRKPTEEENRKQSEWMKKNNPMKGKIGGLHPGAKAVIINGKYFPAGIVAAQEFNVSGQTIISWIRKGKEGCSYVGDTQEDIEARRKSYLKAKKDCHGGNHPRARAVKINGVIYPAIIIASKELNINYNILWGWIREGKPGYAYYNEEKNDKK